MSQFMLIIPKSVLKDILTSWLTLPCVGRSDTALCVKRCRSSFEQILQLGGYSCINSSSSQEEPFLMWVIRRKIHLQDLAVGNWLTEKQERRYQFFKVIGNQLRKVVVCPKTSAHSSNYSDLVSKVLLDMSMFCQNLEELEVLVPNDSGIFALLARNPKLRRVDLEGGPDLLCMVAHYCTNTVDLTISKVDGSTTAKFLDSYPAHLQKLSLIGCNSLRTSAIHRFDVCLNLTELRLGQLIGEGLKQLNASLVNLILFRCTLTTQLSEAVLVAVGRSMPQLQTLIVIATTPTTRDCLTACLKCLPQLRQFVTEASCEGLLRPHPLPDVAHSTLHCVSAPIGAARKFGRSGSATPVCSLEELYFAASLVDYSMNEVFFCCFALKYVGVNCIPEGGFMTACTQARLRRLIVTGNIETEQLNLISGLKELTLHHCSSIKEQSFISLAHRNPDLQVLCIRNAGHMGYSGAPNTVTHHSLRAFLDWCPSLHSVEFMYDLTRSYNQGHPCTKSFVLQLLHEKYPRLRRFESNLT